MDKLKVIEKALLMMHRRGEVEWEKDSQGKWILHSVRTEEQKRTKIPQMDLLQGFD